VKAADVRRVAGTFAPSQRTVVSSQPAALMSERLAR
jgi:hypothetical protein